VDYVGSSTSGSNTRTSTQNSAKIVVAGGFGAGKTTFLGSVSQNAPLTMEALMTEAGKHVSDLVTACSERTVTVSTDFGRVALDADLLLYLFVTPRRERSWFLWDDLVRGAIGAVVLTDASRPQDAREAVSFFESRDLPYIVALNDFGRVMTYDEPRVRDAMEIGQDVPMITCDARDRRFAAKALTALVEYAISRQLPTSRDGSDPRPGGRHHRGPGRFRADEVAG
jgi:uncharacterized protein